MTIRHGRAHWPIHYREQLKLNDGGRFEALLVDPLSAKPKLFNQITWTYIIMNKTLSFWYIFLKAPWLVWFVLTLTPSK